MSLLWLRFALACYFIGLVYAFVALTRTSDLFSRIALHAASLGMVFHFVSIVEEGIVNNRCPITNIYETLSMCSFLVVVVYLFVQWRYKVESLSVFIFPLVYLMSAKI